MSDEEAHSEEIMAALAGAVVIDHSHVLYAMTGNPVHAWRAYLAARRYGVPIPSWALDYLDGCAEALTAADSPRSGKAIADVLGLGKRGGASVTTQAETEKRDLDIVDQVEALRQGDPQRIADVAEQLGLADLAEELRRKPDRRADDIFAKVAERFGLSYERVRDIYYKFPDYLR